MQIGLAGLDDYKVGELTERSSAHPSKQALIWLRSCSLTAPGGQYSSTFQASSLAFSG